MKKKIYFLSVSFVIVFFLSVSAMAQNISKEGVQLKQNVPSTPTQSTIPKIPLTKKQIDIIKRSKSDEVTVPLTDEQYNKIKEHFPNLSIKAITIPTNKVNLAAPFLPGGSVLSAAISGSGQTTRATASLSDSGDD